MLTDIEEVLIRELNGLCGSCRNAPGCVYRRSSTKIIIQCEVFEDGAGTPADSSEEAPAKGLCLNCTKSLFCQLPKGTTGVWHCEEYE